MAKVKAAVSTTELVKAKVSRPGIHSKKKCSKSKKAKNYKKINVGQGK